MPSKTILIIGANSDIGTAITNSLRLVLSPQSTIILHHRSPHSEGVAGDLSNPTAITTLCNSIRQQTPTIDWIIYVAGAIIATETTKLLSPEETRLIFQVNTLAPLHIIEQLETQLNEQGGVILISSTAGAYGNGGYPIYASAKGALNIYAKSLAKRWHPHKHAFSICPGGTNTKMRERIAGDATTQQSPSVIATVVCDMVTAPESFSQSLYLVRDGQVSLLTE